MPPPFRLAVLFFSLIDDSQLLDLVHTACIRSRTVTYMDCTGAKNASVVHGYHMVTCHVGYVTYSLTTPGCRWTRTRT